MKTRMLRYAAALLALAVAGTAAAQSHLMRLADVHDDRIVFTYEGDLWLVSSAGGDARRLTNHPGVESWAKFSPDGRQIAFTGQYDGGLDVYVMDARGGVPRRLTHHPANDRVLGWWPDGKSVLFRSNRAWPQRGEEVYRVSLEGGMSERLPIDRAGLASVSPDGRHIAYNRITRESRTWKRHAGGTAQNIWMGSLEERDYRQIIASEFSDNFPMWHGDTIYFNSDREDGTLNLYAYDVPTQAVTRLTHYKDYDVKYPSLGPGQIVFQYAETLHLLDLASGQIRMVPIEIPSDLVRMRPELVPAASRTGSFRLSPTGKRALFEVRGEILSVPVKEGEAVNLTSTSGSREKNAAWSPDGRWVAFVSDRSGEEEVYLVDARGAPGWRQLTRGGLGFRMHLEWSPDSKYLIFADKFMRLNLVDADTGTVRVLDQAEYDDAWERWGIQDYVWSPCSRWIAYTKMERSMTEAIFLYSLAENQVHRVTGELTQDWSPSFDPEGRYLYFLSNRTFDPIMCFVDQNHIFLDMARPYLLLLRADEPVPFRTQDDQEEVAEDTAAEEPQQAEAAVADGAETRIDIAGLERRIVAAEGVSAGNYFRLEATAGGFLYLHKTAPEFSKYQTVTDDTGGALDLYKYTVADKQAKKLIGGIANYHQSADGKKLIYRAGGTHGVLDAGSTGNVGDGRIDLSKIRVLVDRGAEFMQAFDEAWRIQRDWFYDPNMHGVDWQAMRDKYRKFVPYCGNRADLNYLIGEMIGELNVGHTYVWGGDIDSDSYQVATGLLGAEFARENGAAYYRIAHIIPGTPGDPRERSPLDEPDCPIKVGDYLIAIDGREVRTSDNIFAYLQDKSDAIVTLTYNDRPFAEGARAVRVRTLASEWPIRYREWVLGNSSRVAAATNGQVGYVHIPDMGAAGLIEFARYWYPQYYKHGFIIDARYNGGGFTGDMIIDRLERRIWGMTQPREGRVWRDPERVFVGPWIVLVNEDTGSNGEMFAEAIKIKGLAPVMGMRTWGGAIGIEPHQNLVDGGTVTPPQFGLYGLERQWLIEGRGVEPDIEVQNMPGDVVRGVDAQLDAAVENIMRRLREEPVELPEVPPYPDKSK